MTQKTNSSAAQHADAPEEISDSSSQSSPKRSRKILAAVVKIFTVHAEPNYALPWTVKPQNSSTATGFVIDVGAMHSEFSEYLDNGAVDIGKKTDQTPRRWILSNAHAVQHAAVVQVRLRGSEEKFVARILCVGEECDLALLTVDDSAFWQQLSNGECSAVQLRSSLPRPKERVVVVGYPVGGDSTCITQGVVSRVDLQEYAHGAASLLAVQIDAAINPGNSGGPALDGKGRCVGVAFQSLRDGETENIGYIIPGEVVGHFLVDYLKSGTYRGFGDAGFSYQKLENRGMRKALGLAEGEGGVVIKQVSGEKTPADLLPGDVLLSVAGCPVACDGTVAFRQGERIPLQYLFKRGFVGDSCEVTVKRKKQSNPETRCNTPELPVLGPDDSVDQVTLSIGLSKFSPLVPADPAAPPAYSVIAGLVFTPLSEPFLRCQFGEHFDQEAPVRLLLPWTDGVRKSPEHEVVVLAQVLASPLTVGFHDMKNLILSKVNSFEVKCMADLRRLTDTKAGRWLEFEFTSGERIILSAEEARDAQQEILSKNFIPVGCRE